MSESRDFSVQDILAVAATLYQRGLVVPFMGSGMSRPWCSSWPELLSRLSELARFESTSFLEKRDDQSPLDSAALYRVAEKIVTAMRPLSRDRRNENYLYALRSSDGAGGAIPPQTQALAQIYWPIVVTTNYDDLYWSAVPEVRKPLILGRGREDCHILLRSLDESRPPVLWAIQGFLAGQLMPAEKVISSRERRDSLSDQVVLGHQQYQAAINETEHFRRAFGEIFRRRSLLFFGSGILEEYLVNLFGEILHHHGPGPHTHFALLHIKDREKFDRWFLETRLGITPVFYDDHSFITSFLTELLKLVSGTPLSTDVAEHRSMFVKTERLGFQFCWCCSQPGAN
jgi:hypothetical protein